MNRKGCISSDKRVVRTSVQSQATDLELDVAMVSAKAAALLSLPIAPSSGLKNEKNGQAQQTFPIRIALFGTTKCSLKRCQKLNIYTSDLKLD